jgi:protein-S-isoprenylcysteine O-methyltransferase Ste14
VEQTPVLVVDLLVVGGLTVYLIITFAGWYAGARVQRAAPVGSGAWSHTLPMGVQIVSSLVIVALLLLVIRGPLWIPVPLLEDSRIAGISRLFGLFVFALGLGLNLWARAVLGNMWGISTSASTQLKVDHRLVAGGPFARVRHPIYVGIWLFLAGIALIYRTWGPLLFWIATVYSTVRRAQREETALAASLGTEWRDYAARVPMFFPRLSGG